MRRKILVLILLPVLLSSFLLVGCSFAQQDTSVLSMLGKDWSIKVDSALQTSIDSKAVPTVMVAKAGAEKELFLTLNSLKDCAAGQIEFKVQTSGLSVYKQLPLNQELNVTEYDFVNATVAMKKDKVVVSRPENVVNSFACFDDSGRKVLHVYASKLVDAKGAEIWVDSDLKDGLLTVYLDQKWLETAVFPVVVDPTFGYSSIGASNSQVNANYISCSFKSVLTESADVTAIKFYTNTATGTANVKTAIWNDNSGSPNVLEIASDGVSVTSTPAWVSFSVTKTLSAGTYWLGADGDAQYYVYYDTNYGSNTNADKSGVTYASFAPNPYGTPTNFYNSAISIYVEYTASGEPTPTPTPTPTATPTPSPSPSPTPTLEGDLSDTQWFAGALIFILVIFNIVLFMLPFALMRFVFAIVSLALCALAFAYAVPFSPYLQLLGCLVSVLSMYFASRARE